MLAKVKSIRFLLLTLLAPSLLFQVQAVAAADDIDRFVGRYQGRATITEGNGEIDRDLSVDVSKTKQGFNVKWTSVTRKKDGKLKSKEYTIDFIPTRRANVYAAAMKTNIFGAREPLDPMRGDPYVWARITGDTLGLFALLINDDGGYEMQAYDRTLAAEGLNLKYSRIRDGRQLRTIEALLRRQQ